MALELVSSGIVPGGVVPTNFTCDGDNVSPALRWSNVPNGAQSLALIVDDPDAPRGLFSHWVVYNIPPTLDQFPADMPDSENLDGGAVQGENGFGNIGYGGPCPPPGSEHRYYFRLFALDTLLDLPAGVTRDVVFDRMEGHVLETTEFFGRYRRKGT